MLRLILHQISSEKLSARTNGKSSSGGHAVGARKQQAGVPLPTCSSALPGPSCLVLPNCQHKHL